MIYEYWPSLFFVCITILLTLLIVSINDFFIVQTYDMEKNSAYECGFQPIDLNLQQFEIKYYVIGLLFLIFDIEIAFIVPFLNVFVFLDVFIMINILFFMLCFFLTFLYEWNNYYLDWE